MSSFTELEALTRDSFIECPSDTDWKRAEAEMNNIVFPESFKKLISHVGSGRFGRDLIFINPAVVSFRAAILEFHELISEFMAEGEEFPARLFPDSDGIIPIGRAEKIEFFLNPLDGLIEVIDLDILERIKTNLDLVEFLIASFKKDGRHLEFAEIADYLYPDEPVVPFFSPGFPYGHPFPKQ